MASLKQASAKNLQAERLAMLDSLGEDESNFEDLKTPMEFAASAFVLRVQQNITNLGMSTTGSLSDSLKVNIIDDTHCTITGDAALFFQDRGVNPRNKNLYPETTFTYTSKPPPIQAIKEWVKRKQLVSRNAEKFNEEAKFKTLTDDEKQTQFATAIAYDIWLNKGIKPKNFMRVEIPQYVKDLVELVQQQTINGVAGKLIQNMNGTTNRGATRLDTPSSSNRSYKEPND